MGSDHFVIDRRYTDEIKVKGSKFIADIFYVDSTEQVQDAIAVIKTEHPKARHHCWAYKLGVPTHSFRANDDNEPTGTAGKPILGQLDSFKVTNIICIVTRYFGGTLLGTGGLIKAYKDAAKLTLSQAGRTEVRPVFHILVRFDFEQMPMVMNAAKRFPGIIIEKHLSDDPYLILATESEDLDYMMNLFKSYVLGITLDYASEIVDPGFKIEKLMHD